MGLDQRLNLCSGWPPAYVFPAEQAGDHHEIVREDGGAHQEFEPFPPFDERALHAATSEQHGDTAFDPGAEALAVLEGRTFSSASRSALRLPPDCGMHVTFTPAV